LQVLEPGGLLLLLLPVVLLLVLAVPLSEVGRVSLHHTIAQVRPGASQAAGPRHGGGG
jgi:hypothetical protein